MLAITTSFSNNEQYTIEEFEEAHADQLQCFLQETLSCSSVEAASIKGQIVIYLKQQAFEKTFTSSKEIWQLIHKFVAKEQMKNAPSRDKNFGLTLFAFEEMLQRLEQGDKGLFEKVFMAHFQNCRLYLQRNYKASPEDAYDVTMDTMLEFCKRLLAGKIKYGNLRFLFTQMAGQIYLKWIKKQQVRQSIEGVDIPDLSNTLEESYFQTLEKAWEGLCVDCQKLLEEFYYKEIELKAIAVQVEKSAAAVRKQKQRCVEKLQKLFIQYNK